MPFKSEAQRRYLWAHEPAVARKWTAEYGAAPQPNKTLVRKALLQKMKAK